MTVQPQACEQGAIVSMGTYALGGCGHICADNGDMLALCYWSIIEGSHTLRVGQRVTFSRARFGFDRAVGTLVAPVLTDANSN